MAFRRVCVTKNMAYNNPEFEEFRQKVQELLCEDDTVLLNELRRFINDRKNERYKELIRQPHIQRLSGSTDQSREFIWILDELTLLTSPMNYDEKQTPQDAKNTFLYDFIVEAELLSKFKLLILFKKFYKDKFPQKYEGIAIAKPGKFPFVGTDSNGIIEESVVCF
ncbi:unnamed protein product [Didymodactylos carnosus]|uniref:Uncharacterized protein n=1 Tax=Didymodactylos carnosus TaxID=1234261 RepID=A0A814KIZ2_9BILA|nr:unnamed protein product [Didymodactylos carnosus]CAF3821985.1 unnamed protein product [Didymodactylos carnosus]